jgi:LacI family transcriptional regulator
MPKSKRVLLLMDPDRGWTRDLLIGISKYCRLHNPWGVYRLSQFYWRPEHKRHKNEIKNFMKWKPDGIITREMDHVEDLIQIGVPVIGSDSPQNPPNIPIMTSDYGRTGELAAEYFLKKGYKDFAFCGYSDVAWSTKRLEGFQQTLRSKGFEVKVYMKSITSLKQLWTGEIERLAKWLKTLPKSTGVMTCSDERSLHVLEACKSSSILVPEEIAILGVDNDELLCDLASPSLSSIAFDTESIGYETAQILDKMMNGKKVSNVNIVARPIRVIDRRSTDICAIQDPQLVSALAYIREHKFKLLRVSDVVGSTNISRRNLELKFKKWLNRSILDELKMNHVDLMAELLIETNYSISKIASMLGHPNTDNICRYFKSQKKISPDQYRRKYEKSLVIDTDNVPS